MHLIPDIKLPDPDELQLNYDADFFSFLDSCLPGIKFINIQRRTKQNKFESPFKIILQERPSVHQRPHEKPDEICATVMSVIQYDIESRDESGSYRVQCFRNTGNSKDSVKAKIISIDLEEQSAHINDYGRFKDDDEAMPLTSLQAQYIQMLQDQIIKIQSLVTSVTSSLTETVKSQQGTIQDLMSKSVEIERIRSYERLREKEETNEIDLAKIKEKNKTERWNSSMSLLNDSGAIKEVGKSLANVVQKKFLSGQAPELPDPELPKRDPGFNNQVRPNFKGKSNNQETDNEGMTTKNNQKNEEKNRENDENVNQNIENNELTQKDIEDIEEQLRTQPLKCRVDVLRSHFTNEQALELKEMIGEDLFKAFAMLLMSESEDEAKQNLLMIRGNVSPNDIQKLIKAKVKIFTEKQQGLIDEILMFDFGEE